MFYLIDSNAVIHAPQILALKASDLIIPTAIIDELVSRGTQELRERLATLINETLSRGAKAVDPKQRPKASEHSRKLSFGDLEILQIAKEFTNSHGKENLTVITLDSALVQELSKIGVKTSTPEEALSAEGDRDKKTSGKAEDLAKFQTRHLIFSATLGAAITLASVLAYANASKIISFLEKIAPTIAPPLVALILGVAMFWIRQKWRLAYGIAELLIGIATATAFFTQAIKEPYSALPFVAGLYVIVRGMDNIGKGLEGSRLERLWLYAFRTR
ncbi:hypothetical protein JY419_01680 [Stenotrophomonas maltophilia]|nr:hypothetical protein [Stenotrophomonas maltophilia]